MLAAFANDEPWMTMALDATLAWPLGNPGNYFDKNAKAYGKIPDYWGRLRYPGITYYGGAMFMLASPVYAALRVAGLPPFPTAPIILRCLTVLAAGLSLLVLYNIAGRFASTWAGVLACLYLMTDTYFTYYTTNIHPDTLQLLFGLLAFTVAVRHAREGDLPSLVALGILCGIIQGTKVGGPWTVPMALLALGWGIHATGGRIAELRTTVKRGALLGAAAIVGYAVSTPYGFLSFYLLKTLSVAWLIQGIGSASPFGEITLWSWITTLYEYIGPAASILVMATIARVAVGGFIANSSQRAFTLALVVSLSQLLWFGVAGKLWHVPGYLLVAFALMGVLCFDTAIVFCQRVLQIAFYYLPSGRKIAAGLGTATILAAAIPLGAPLLINITMRGNLDLMLYRQSTYLAMNDWATQGGVPHNAKILYDDLGYFDPNLYPNARTNGSVLTWSRVEQEDPEYIVLSSSIFEAPHYKSLIATQRLEPTDPYIFSVRLYQDLLPYQQPGPTKIPGIDFIAEFKAQPVQAALPTWSPPLGNVLTDWALYRFWVADVYARQALALAQKIVSPGNAPVMGTTLRVYHRNDINHAKGAGSNARSMPSTH